MTNMGNERLLELATRLERPWRKVPTGELVADRAEAAEALRTLGANPMTDELVERLLRKVQVQPAQGSGSLGTRADGTLEAKSQIWDDGYRLANPDGPEAAARIQSLTADNAVLREHIREQIEHVDTRIQDGIEMGATVWRIALEDVARENRNALSQTGWKP